VLAWRPLVSDDLLPLALVLVGTLLGVVVATRWRAPAPVSEAGSVAPDPWARIGVGVGALIAGFTVLALVPLWGSVASVGRGAVLASVEIACALLLVRAARGEGATRTAALALRGPGTGIAKQIARALGRTPAWLSPSVVGVFVATAPLAAIGLWWGGGLLLRLVPATGEAPIETLVAWPSGSLAVAIVAVLVPIAEELFFRGFVYGAIEDKHGRSAAFLLTVFLFTLAHVPQVWGAWGALVSIALTGVVLTGLRAASGSTTVAALAHLGHNALVALVSVASSSA
jgi:membrane protease YdiL (CAAX protease family)